MPRCNNMDSYQGQRKSKDSAFPEKTQHFQVI